MEGPLAHIWSLCFRLLFSCQPASCSHHPPPQRHGQLPLSPTLPSAWWECRQHRPLGTRCHSRIQIAFFCCFCLGLGNVLKVPHKLCKYSTTELYLRPFLFVILRHDLTKLPRLPLFLLGSLEACPASASSGAMHHHTWPAEHCPLCFLKRGS